MLFGLDIFHKYFLVIRFLAVMLDNQVLTAEHCPRIVYEHRNVNLETYGDILD